MPDGADAKCGWCLWCRRCQCILYMRHYTHMLHNVKHQRNLLISLVPIYWMDTRGNWFKNKNLIFSIRHCMDMSLRQIDTWVEQQCHIYVTEAERYMGGTTLSHCFVSLGQFKCNLMPVR